MSEMKTRFERSCISFYISCDNEDISLNSIDALSEIIFKNKLKDSDIEKYEINRETYNSIFNQKVYQEDDHTFKEVIEMFAPDFVDYPNSDYYCIGFFINVELEKEVIEKMTKGIVQPFIENWFKEEKNMKVRVAGFENHKEYIAHSTDIVIFDKQGKLDVWKLD